MKQLNMHFERKLKNFENKYEKILPELEKIAFSSVTYSTVSHDQNHLKRVALYASELIDFFGGTKQEKELAYIAGIFHDYARGVDNHNIASAKKTREILQKYNFNAKDLDIICAAIENHNNIPSKLTGAKKVSDAIGICDKLFEANGAYICFRRAMFMAQTKNKKRSNQSPVDATLLESFARTSKFNPKKYPTEFFDLAKKQHKWQDEFIKALEKKEEWAVNLVESMYNFGKENKLSLNQAITNYEPVSNIDARFKNEAIKYITGNKKEEFFSILKNQQIKK